MAFCTLGPIWSRNARLARWGRSTPFPHAYRENRPIFQNKGFPLNPSWIMCRWALQDRLRFYNRGTRGRFVIFGWCLAWVCLLVVLSCGSGCCVLLYLDLTWARIGRRTSETTSLSPIWAKTGRRILRPDSKQVGDSPSPTCL